MDFIFKLSFFLHSVTNQNFKKKKKKQNDPAYNRLEVGETEKGMNKAYTQ